MREIVSFEAKNRLAEFADRGREWRGDHNSAPRQACRQTGRDRWRARPQAGSGGGRPAGGIAQRREARRGRQPEGADRRGSAVTLVLDGSATPAWCFEDQCTPTVAELIQRVAIYGALGLPAFAGGLEFVDHVLVEADGNLLLGMRTQAVRAPGFRFALTSSSVPPKPIGVRKALPAVSAATAVPIGTRTGAVAPAGHAA